MIFLVVAVTGILLLAFLYWQRANQNSRDALARELIKQAEAKASMIVEQAKLDAKKIAHNASESAQAFSLKEEQQEREKHRLKAHAQELEKKEKALQEREKKLQEEQSRHAQHLNYSLEDTRKQLLKQAEDETEAAIQHLYLQKRQECEEKVDAYAHSLVVATLSRLPYKPLSDASISEVMLPSEELKAKIIGREGKNIKAFQQLTGVTVVIDETPEVLILSSFDRERREIAKIALEALIKDGRITTARIEEEVKAASLLLDKSLIRYGQEAADYLHLHNLHPTLLMHLGRLKLRSSLGQNLLEHSIEVAQIMGLIAAELKLNISKATRMGLLHDIGKAVTSDTPLSHALAGYRLLLDCSEAEEIANGVGCHHDEMPPSTLEAGLVKYADYLSGARRGVRAENSESFFKRLVDFEAVAKSFPGVKNAFALSSGRELQVFVRPEVVDDTQALLLAKQIAGKIQPLSPTHRIQISVLRETKAVEYTQ